MKKQMFYESMPFLLRKMLFRLTIFTVFSLLATQSAFAQTWPILGNEQAISSVVSSYSSIAVVNNGVDYTPYVAYTESGVPKVKKRLGDGTWVQVGANLGTNASSTQIYADPIGNLYVAYIDVSASSKLAIQKYDYVNEVWNALNPSDSNSLYVSTGNVNQASSKFNGLRFSIAFDSFNTPYVAFTDAGLIPYVKKFNSDTAAWETIGSGAVTSGYAALPSLAIDSTDKPWLLYTRLTATADQNGSLALFSFNGTTWTESLNPTPIGGIRQSCIANNGTNKLCIAMFDTGNGNKTTVVYFDKTTSTWSSKSNLSTRDGQGINLINDSEGNIYCSYMDKYDSSVYSQVARVHKLTIGGTSWTELTNSAATRGIDEPTGNLSIAIGSAPYPYIVYTKPNTSAINTPIVRAYAPAPPPAPPAVIATKEATNINTMTADVAGDITSDGGTAITERGIVYGTSNNPTTANTKVIDGVAGIGTYNVSLSGLSPATLYYARAYAINGGGNPTTTYGNNVRLNTLSLPDAVVSTPKQMEFLNRGVVAVRKSTSQVFISWRLLGNDPSGIAFNIYRDNVKLNSSPITTSTNYLDDVTTNGNYVIKTVIGGTEGTASAPVSVWANNQLSIPLQIPAGGTTPNGTAYTYTANDASVGDVDGDGEYEIFLKWDPTALNHNSGGYSGDQIFDCYKMNGTLLWRINLGKNVNAGPHFNQFMVYDFDGDGKSEIILKTADGTVDGKGVVIGNASIDYRNTSGWVQQGPEFLTVFNGLTGAAMSTVAYQPARANTSDWGDSYGNRQDRFVSAVAYLDGARPSLIVGRGYYDKLMRAAYDWRDGQLTLRWIFDSKDPNNPANNAFSSQGNHQMTIGDVDGDGKDEVINGSSAIDDDGTRLWTYGQGHGDALHMSDMDPDRPGMEIWQCLESEGQYSPYGIRLNDAKTGKMIFGAQTTGDVGRALAADVDPNHRGYEMWSSSGDFYNVQDGLIGTAKPTGGSQAVNGAVWWDGDLGRELLDGTIMDKWNPTTKSLNRLFTIYQAAPVSSNNDSKKNPALTGDLLGDWREEILLRRSDNTALILFTTNISSDYRITTLMHDPQYRTAIAWQNSGYNQPPHPSFFLGYDMPIAPTPNIEVKTASTTNLGIDTPTVSVLSDAAVYPNPSAGQFSVQFDGYNSAKATLSVIDINGRTILQKEVKLIGGKQIIPLSIPNHAQGVYFLKIQTEEGEKTIKIVVEK